MEYVIHVALVNTTISRQATLMKGEEVAHLPPCASARKELISKNGNLFLVEIITVILPFIVIAFCLKLFFFIIYYPDPTSLKSSVDA